MHTIHGNLLNVLLYTLCYVCTAYTHMYIQYVYSIEGMFMYYAYAYTIPVSSSVTEAVYVATLITPNENRTEHSITITCTIRPESDADMCVVMAMADDGMTRSGK